jgi:phage-related protein
MATFTWTPEFPIERLVEPRALRAQFGDGYAQVAADGINARLGRWPLRFEQRALSEITAIDTFLHDNAFAVIDWTPPGGSAIKVRVREWRRTRGNAVYASMSVTFEEVAA